MGVAKIIGTRKYVGLLSMVGRKKKALFNYLRDHLWNQIHSWSGKNLSRSRKEVLVKFVAQAFPNHYMSVFLFPTSLREEMEHMMISFWWGSSRNQNKGIRWMSWEKLKVWKSNVGMGFRNLYCFNISMLEKQAWKFLTNQDAIVTRVFKANFFSNWG